MSLFSLLAVPLIEQAQPLPNLRLVHEPPTWCYGFLESWFNAGPRRHGTLAWLVGVGGLMLVAAGVHLFLPTSARFSPGCESPWSLA
ncbi:MAG: hypothetical protein ABTS22_00215 [Accumulibacter sp.]|jgi:hypothetical protein|uniref:hypothetical protein n=1 Tax=Accumulibacter sp. TaxID=2053492 RepID=UPI00258B03F6|nr:hypothetical protein [Accumulibacter sp.]